MAPVGARGYSNKEKSAGKSAFTSIFILFSWFGMSCGLVENGLGYHPCVTSAGEDGGCPKSHQRKGVKWIWD